MDAFGSSSSNGSGSPQMSTGEFMDKLKTQLAMAYAEEFLETVRGKCFEKCITKPARVTKYDLELSPSVCLNLINKGMILSDFRDEKYIFITTGCLVAHQVSSFNQDLKFSMIDPELEALNLRFSALTAVDDT
ncbi:Mitochondrial import inner membrane translocase subunit TIM13-like protein [Drosera capensis]